MKKTALLTALLVALALCLPALAQGEGWGLWQPLEATDSIFPDVNFKRFILDAQGREIRVQQGLGSNEMDIILKWDTSYRYEDTAEGLVIQMEETQFDIDGTVSRYVRQTTRQEMVLDIQWLSPEGKLVMHKRLDPETGLYHRLWLYRNLDGAEGAITISEAELPGEGPANREVLYHFKADGSFEKAEHYVRSFLASSFKLEPHEGQPTEAVLKMAADWFSKPQQDNP